jgi:hypothetical protein
MDFEYQKIVFIMLFFGRKERIAWNFRSPALQQPDQR